MSVETCDECGFAWDLSYDDAVALVEAAPRWFMRIFAEGGLGAPPPGVWSAGAYLWHVVDVLRSGTERFWLLGRDPERGIAAWDENLLAEARRYEDLSPAVGLRALKVAAADWVLAAREAPRGVSAAHPELGSMDALAVARRNAHEVVHHLMDVRRQKS